jgi:hypothetical protein
MLTKRGLRIYRIVLRVTASISLAELVMATFWPAYSYWTANGCLGTPLVFWHISASLVLPLFVGFEAWWVRKVNAELSGIWVDAALAAACFALFWGGIAYASSHSAII